MAIGTLKINPIDVRLDLVRKIGDLDNRYVNVSGDTMTGNLTVPTLTATTINTPSLTLDNFTEGSVLFVGTDELISEDNGNFFWDDTANTLKISGMVFGAGSITDVTGEISFGSNALSTTGQVITGSLIPADTGITEFGSPADIWAIGFIGTLETDEIRDTSVITAIDVGSRNLFDTVGQFSVDFENRTLANSTEATTIHWENQQLLVNGDAILDWSTVGLAEFGNSKIQTTGVLAVGNASQSTAHTLQGDSFPVTRLTRTTAATNQAGATFDNVLKSTGNMADGHGAGFVWSIQDDTFGPGIIGAMYALRDGADTQGRLSLRVNSGLTEALVLRTNLTAEFKGLISTASDINLTGTNKITFDNVLEFINSPVAGVLDISARGAIHIHADVNNNDAASAVAFRITVDDVHGGSPVTIFEQLNSGNIGIGGAANTGTLITGKIGGVSLMKLTNTAASSASQGAGVQWFHDDGAAMGSGHRLGFIVMGGAKDNAGTLNNSLAINGMASENWSATNAGARWEFLTTLNGSTSRAVRWTITDAGHWLGGNDKFIGINMAGVIPLHEIQVNDAGENLGTDWDAATPTAAIGITGADAYLEIVSTDVGTWGSALTFKQVDGTVYENAWGIIRQTDGDGPGDGSLRFTYGTSVEPYVNTAMVIFGTDASITTTGSIHLKADNAKHFFGAADDASVRYDGSDLLINPSEVGSGSVVLPKASSQGIKVDLTTPTFGFADIIGDQFAKNTGATKPVLITYNGVINGWRFAVSDEAFMSFHIPHDYVKGTPIFLHIHWSHTGSSVTGGTITFKITSIYSKGHNQAPFQSSPSVGTFTGTASNTQYQHILSEIQYSDTTPAGLEIDTDDLEPDGVIEMTFEVDANNITVSGGGVPDPFIHFVDIHYQTTGLIGTKDKVPDFYT